MPENHGPKLGLVVNICPGSGFCSGVTRAVRMAETLLDRGEEVFCVGKIVHNEAEIKRLQGKGLRMISLEDILQLRNSNILFRAHGEPPSSYDLAVQNGNRLIDATCKIVLRIQQRIKEALGNGEAVVIYGKSDHPEVRGLQGQGQDEIILLESLNDAEAMPLPDQISLFCQTTKSLEEYYQMAAVIKNRGIMVRIYDTVCRQVSNREGDLRAFSKQQDRVIFVSGKDSSNGKVLFGVCKSANPNSYHISSTEDIDPGWFTPGSKVGLAGATSTPEWYLEKIKKYLLEL